MIVPGSKYLLAVLNSKVADWYIRQLGVTRRRLFWIQANVCWEVAVPPETRESHNLLEEMVDKILAAKKGGTSTDELENCIDQYVYSLYGLDPSEIRYIESQWAPLSTISSIKFTSSEVKPKSLYISWLICSIRQWSFPLLCRSLSSRCVIIASLSGVGSGIGSQFNKVLFPSQSPHAGCCAIFCKKVFR